MNITDILEDSPNGYDISRNVPEDVDEAIRHYLVLINGFPAERFPLEYALSNYALGKLLFADTSRPKVSEERARRIENGLYHLNNALQVLNQRDYPVMFSIISTMMGHLYRERALLTSNRSFLSDRATPEDSIAFGIDQLLEAFPVFFLCNQYVFEHAVCSLEAGWLYVLQSELLEHFKDDSTRQQAATYLDRALSLSQSLAQRGHAVYTVPGQAERVWNPLGDHHLFPEHIQVLMCGKKLSHLEGCALYLLGRLYQGWIAPEVKDSFDSSSSRVRGTTVAAASINSSPSFELRNMEQAFEYLCKSLRPKYLSDDNEEWADAHHRAALLLIKYPRLLADEEEEEEKMKMMMGGPSDMQLEMAVRHLNLALRCDALSNAAAMDIHFHLAQCAISRLQLIIDRVPIGSSVTRAIREHLEGVELVQLIEEHLQDALQRVTPASSQTTQDGYLYFFSSLKLSEYRMLEAACTPALLSAEREACLHDAVSYMVNALVSRSLTDNTDLHYIACSQLSQLLLAVKRHAAASKSYAKGVLALSLLVNRSIFAPGDSHSKLLNETLWHIGEGLVAGTKDVEWVKLHFGPLSLNERTTAGYASWSFEDAESERAGSLDEEEEEEYIATRPVKASLDNSYDNDLSPHKKASPPKGVPPLMLPMTSSKRVHASGEEMSGFAAKDKLIGGRTAEEEEGDRLRTKKPPPGAVPLFALGHNPRYDVNANVNANAAAAASAAAGESNYAVGPYGRRMRRKVPPLSLMSDIDRSKMNAFGFTKGAAAFLLPSHIRRPLAQHPKQQRRARGSGGPDSSATVYNKLYGKSKNHHSLSTLDEKGDEGQDEEQEMDPDESLDDLQTDEGSVHNGVDVDDGDDGGDEQIASVRNRERSERIKPSDLGSGRRPTDESSSAGATDPDPNPKPYSDPKRSGLLSWLVGSRPVDMSGSGSGSSSGPSSSSSSNKSKKSSQWQWFRPPKPKKEKVEVVKGPGQLWASPSCFFVYMMLSRQSRMELVIRSSKLSVFEGERVSYLLYKLKPKYLNAYYESRKQLTLLCSKLLSPSPTTLKEFTQLSQIELHALFKSQAKLYGKMRDLEILLYEKISKDDDFIPYVALVPVFTRDLSEYDASLLNAERLLANISNEDALLQYKASKKEATSSAATRSASSEMIHHSSSIREEPKFKYDSVSSAATSHQPSTSAVVLGPKSVLTAHQKLLKQERDEKEEVSIGKMTYSMCQALDGGHYLRNSMQGSRDMLERYLAKDECIMMWHLPVIHNQCLQVVLVWRDDSISLYENFSSQMQRDKDKANKKKGRKRGSAEEGERVKPIYENRGIVMEIAKSDVPSSHMLHYLQAYLDALHMQSAPKRLTMSSDALRALSCALSLTEFFHMIPPHVRSLVVCCPVQMRLIPWHLLLIEEFSDKPFLHEKKSNRSSSGDGASASSSQRSEVHLCEKFRVRLGPTLALFELNARGEGSLSQRVGMHRMCLVDGEPDGPERRPGIRGTDLEVACVSHTWSSDPNDSHILSNASATPTAMQTGLSKHGGSDSKYVEFKKSMEIKRGSKVDHMVLNFDDKSGGFKDVKAKRSEGKTAASPESLKNDRADVSSNGDDKDSKLRTLSGTIKQHSDDPDVQSLTFSRVLHIAALKRESSTVDNIDIADLPRSKSTYEAGIVLPQRLELVAKLLRDPSSPSSPMGTTQRGGGPRSPDAIKEDAMKMKMGWFTSRDVIKQLRVSNCALCVLSHFDLTSDVQSLRANTVGVNTCDANCEFLEALHLAGAKTILSPLWNGNSEGIAALAHLLFQIRFYSVLPSLSKDKTSVVEACRTTQLWMRDLTADETIAFLNKCSIPEQARRTAIDELESYVDASLTPAQRRVQEELKAKFRDAKNLAASPGKTPPPDPPHPNPTDAADQDPNPNPVVSAEAAAAVDDSQTRNRIGGDKKFFHHFLYWGSFTVSGSGGSVHHPDLTLDKDEGYEKGHISWNDKELNNMALEAAALRMEGKMEEAVELEDFIRLKRKERLKKKIDAARAAGARVQRKFMDTLEFLDKKFLDQGSSDEISVSDESDHGVRQAAKGSDDDDVRSDVSFDDDDPLKTKSKPTPKFTPQALELGSSKAEDIEFEKWKSKVGRLDMNVREPLTLLRSSSSKQQQPRSDIYKLKDGHQKSGSRTVTGGSRDAAVADQHKDSQEQDDDVADASSSDDGDDDSDEVDQDGSDGSSNEGSGSDDDSFAELEEHSRKKKQKKQPPSRLMLVFKDIKQSVRSYSDVAKVIVELPAVAVDVAGKSASNSSENDDDDDDEEEKVSGRRKKKKGCSIS